MAASASQRRLVPLARGKAWLTALAAAALLLRLLLPPMPMPAIPTGIDPVLAELLAGGGICHADADAPNKGMPSPGSVACLLCPLCAAPLPLLASAPPLPLPAVVAFGIVALWPPATAPPAVAFRPANPRAPPARSA